MRSHLYSLARYRWHLVPLRIKFQLYGSKACTRFLSVCSGTLHENNTTGEAANKSVKHAMHMSHFWSLCQSCSNFSFHWKVCFNSMRNFIVNLSNKELPLFPQSDSTKGKTASACLQTQIVSKFCIRPIKYPNIWHTNVLILRDLNKISTNELFAENLNYFRNYRQIFFQKKLPLIRVKNTRGYIFEKYL